jgi:DNA-binding sugar fermentation-stimulating protein
MTICYVALYINWCCIETNVVNNLVMMLLINTKINILYKCFFIRNTAHNVMYKQIIIDFFLLSMSKVIEVKKSKKNIKSQNFKTVLNYMVLKRVDFRL